MSNESSTRLQGVIDSMMESLRRNSFADSSCSCRKRRLICESCGAPLNVDKQSSLNGVAVVTCDYCNSLCRI